MNTYGEQLISQVILMKSYQLLQHFSSSLPNTGLFVIV